MPDVVRKADVDRERERLRRHEEEFPALSLLLVDLPDDYDPQQEPEEEK